MRNQAKKILAAALMIMMLFTIVSVNNLTSAEEPFAPIGQYTEGDYVQREDCYICSEGEFKSFKRNIGNGYEFEGISVFLANDITLTDPACVYGNVDSVFCGIFDGRGHSVTYDFDDYDNFYGNRVMYVTPYDESSEENEDTPGWDVCGLITSAESAEIRNVIVCGNIRASKVKFGAAIVGYAADTKIENCENNATLKKFMDDDLLECVLGGIVGYVWGDSIVSGCRNTGNILAGADLGGIVGEAGEGSNIICCTNSGSLVAHDVGGIAYRAKGCVVDGCCNEGLIKGIACGGVVTIAEGGCNISGCVNRGSVKGNLLGGIVCRGSDCNVQRCSTSRATLGFQNFRGNILREDKLAIISAISQNVVFSECKIYLGTLDIADNTALERKVLAAFEGDWVLGSRDIQDLYDNARDVTIENCCVIYNGQVRVCNKDADGQLGITHYLA